MAIPDSIVRNLEVQLPHVRRRDERRANAGECLERLGLPDDPEVSEFFLAYNLVVANKREDIELLDVVDMEGPTALAKEVYGVPADYVALTSGEGDGFLLYSLTQRAVFEVDAGQFDDLIGGRIAPRWSSFYDLIEWYTTS